MSTPQQIKYRGQIYTLVTAATKGGKPSRSTEYYSGFGTAIWVWKAKGVDVALFDTGALAMFSHAEDEVELDYAPGGSHTFPFKDLPLAEGVSKAQPVVDRALGAFAKGGNAAVLKIKGWQET